MPTNKPRMFEYSTWTWPISVAILPVAVLGLLGDKTALRFQFRNVFRTGKERHKTFMPASPIKPGDQS